MIKTMLKNSDTISLELLRLFIYQQENIEISALIEKCSLSRTSVKRHIQHLNDLFKADELKLEIKQNEKHKYYLFNPSSIDNNYIFFKVQLTLLECSISFSLVKLVFTNSSLPQNIILDQLCICENTLYKEVNKANILLENFSIKIRKKNNIYSLDGPNRILDLSCLAFL